MSPARSLGVVPRLRHPTVLAVCLLVALPAAGSAATITVDALCSLVSAINSANTDSGGIFCEDGSGADTLVMTDDVFLTFVNNDTDGPNALPSITSEITIAGGGYRIGRTKAAAPMRFFHVGLGGDLTLQNLALERGYAQYEHGGAIYIIWGEAHLERVALIDNKAEGTTLHPKSGGAVFAGNQGEFTAKECSFIGNRVLGSGGRGGAVYFEYTTISIDDSTFSGNELPGSVPSSPSGETASSATAPSRATRFPGRREARVVRSSAPRPGSPSRTLRSSATRCPTGTVTTSTTTTRETCGSLSRSSRTEIAPGP